MPATIDDPIILDEIGAALKTLGYPEGLTPALTKLPAPGAWR